MEHGCTRRRRIEMDQRGQDEGDSSDDERDATGTCATLQKQR